MQESKNIQNTILHQRSIEDPFSPVPKTILDDRKLSWKAKGLLAYLLGRPPGWKVQVSDICNRGKDGELSVRAGLKELRDAHYVRLERQIDTKGRLTGWLWIVSDTPNLLPETASKKQTPTRSDHPHLENRDVDNEYLSKTELSKTEGKVRMNSANPSDFADVSFKNSVRKESVKNQSKPESKHNAFIDMWGTEYENFHGRNYTFSQRDYKAVKEIVMNDSTNEEMIRFAKIGWASADPFVRNPSANIFSFPNVINRIAVEASRPAYNNHNI